MAKKSAPKLGLIAGKGSLPRQIAEHCKQTGREYFIIAFKDQTDESLTKDHPHIWLRMGKIGEAVKKLNEEKVKEIVMAGSIRRPALSSLKLDFAGVKLIARINRLRNKGDDAMLRAIIEFLEEENFKVVGAETILEDLLAQEGTMGKIEPDSQALSDMEIGLNALSTTGELDVGQAAIVQSGRILGVEGAEGTDGLITRCKDLHDDTEPGGVLVKIKKGGQETRVDLPAIGIHTIENAHKHNLRGIALEAGAAVIVDKDKTIARADKLGLFVVGISRS